MKKIEPEEMVLVFEPENGQPENWQEDVVFIRDNGQVKELGTADSTEGK